MSTRIIERDWHNEVATCVDLAFFISKINFQHSIRKIVCGILGNKAFKKTKAVTEPCNQGATNKAYKSSK